jgi:hypothetical protein
MHDILIFHDDVYLAHMMCTACQEEGYKVTCTSTVQETLEALRTAPHSLIVLAERDHSSLHPDGPFFEIIRDHPDLYGRHRYIAMHWLSLSEEEIALLDGLGVPRLEGPFTVERLVDVLEAERERGERERQQQEQQELTPAVLMMLPRKEEALGHLISQILVPPYPENPRARSAEILRRDAKRMHMLKVSARSKSPAELRTRLIRDGTIPDEPVIEWYDRDGHYRDVSYMLKCESVS